jgi:hypothetical protein
MTWRAIFIASVLCVGGELTQCDLRRAHGGELWVPLERLPATSSVYPVLSGDSDPPSVANATTDDSTIVPTLESFTPGQRQTKARPAASA